MNDKSRINFNRRKRRKFLKYVGGASTGLLGVNRAAIGTAKRDTNQRLIVWTRNQNGDPEAARYISKERYRRLMVYKNLNINDFLNEYPTISFISMGSQPGESKLMLELFVSERRNSLPEDVDDVPTFIKEIEKVNYQPECRDGDEYDVLRSNIEISVDIGNDTHSTGTIGLIGYNSDPNDSYECIVTSYHIVEGSTNNEMYQPAFGDVAGNQRQDDFDMDTTKYEAEFSADVGATEEPNQEDITGTWDFAGLTDATDGTDGVDAEFAGKETCSESAECIGTTRDNIVKYQANYKDEHGVSGDSGGPYVDQDGKLVSLHYGDKTVDTPEGEKTYSIGPVGTETIQRLDVTLDDPSNVE